jgi:hypothetical protein
MCFPAARRGGDKLQQLRAVLPCEVKVTSPTHPLFGRLLAANGFKRWNGELMLVVGLPDGSPGTIPASATDVLAVPAVVGLHTYLSADGLRRLHQLVASFGPAERRRRPKTRK